MKIPSPIPSLRFAAVAVPNDPRASSYYPIPANEIAPFLALQPKQLAKQLAWQGHNGTPPQTVIKLNPKTTERPYRTATFRLAGSPDQYTKEELAKLAWFAYQRYPAYRTEEIAIDNTASAYPFLIQKEPDGYWAVTRATGQNGKRSFRTQYLEAVMKAIADPAASSL